MYVIPTKVFVVASPVVPRWYDAQEGIRLHGPVYLERERAELALSMVRSTGETLAEIIELDLALPDGR